MDTGSTNLDNLTVNNLTALNSDVIIDSGGVMVNPASQTMIINY